VILRLFHLGCRHHLHGFGDLHRVLDAFDSASDVAGVGHVLG